MKFFKGCGSVLLWIGYIVLMGIEWVIDTVEKLLVVFHSCLIELTTGIKKTIDEIKL